MRFQHYSMAGAVALVGCSIFALAGAVVFSTLGNSAQAGVGSAAPAVTAAAVAQGGGEPTIVWYGIGQAIDGNYHPRAVLVRAWSDSKVESLRIDLQYPDYCPIPSSCGWRVVSSPQQGLNAAADITFDESVDAQDLAQVLSNWGPAPRNDIPPSDCPLNLVNP